MTNLDKKNKLTLIPPPFTQTLQLRVVIVTVTYANRWHLLRQSLESAFREGAVSAVVVDNGAQDPIARHASIEFNGKVKVVTLPTNTGSANGFKIGIETALTNGAEIIWLLDDDNLPKPSALESLISAYKMHRSIIAIDNFALLSFRPDHQADIAAGVPFFRCYPRPGSFFGFHLLDVPYKMWRRTPWGRPKKQTTVLPEFISVPHAPYSGFFCHRSVFERIGLPKTDFVLYADDTEFTSRLTNLGGHIFLIPSSRIDDLEASWNIKSRFKSSFLGWLCGCGELRAFYGARNQAFLETHPPANHVMRNINRAVYISFLTIFAFIHKRKNRLTLLLDAIHIGESGILGIDERFPLS